MANSDDERPRSINDLNLRDDIIEDVPSELPEQLGGAGLPTLLPGTHIFRLPTDIISCILPRDEILYEQDGNPIPDPNDPSKARVVQRLMLRFNKDNPLIVVGSPEDGLPVGTTITNIPRNRARKGEPRVMASDMAYLLRDSLSYNGPLSKNSEWVQALQSVAGRIVRLEHGLSAWCNPERPRYINDDSDPTHRGSILDPSGQKGCGGGVKKERYYTQHFKVPAQNGQPGGYTDIVYCRNCGAKLRGFFAIERFLKPTPAMLADRGADDVPF